MGVAAKWGGEKMKAGDEKKTKQSLEKGVIAAVCVMILSNSVCDQIYAGEFGGFDIDIGGEQDILENWEDETGVNPEPDGAEESKENNKENNSEKN